MRNCLVLAFLLLTTSAYAETPVAPALAGTDKVMTPQEYVHLGNVAGRDEKYKEAIRDFTKAIQDDPGFVSAYYNRGYYYIEMRRYKQAISDLDKAVEINPAYAPAYHVRGIAYFSRNKYKQAVADYRKAIELEPANVKFHISLLSLYFKIGQNSHAWEEVIKIQKLGGTVNPSIVNLLKNRKYRER